MTDDSVHDQMPFFTRPEGKTKGRQDGGDCRFHLELLASPLLRILYIRNWQDATESSPAEAQGRGEDLQGLRG